ncbi:MAG: asparagine synthase C-terminal domain-containing protein, partial [Thermodesulfobacteriota bacterium]
TLVREMSRVMDPVRTFSLGFAGWDKSEHLYAKMVAERFGTRHADLVADGGSLSLLPELSTVYDEPIADISTIPTFLISQRAAQDVKAVLSGEGADEQFCGYTWHKDVRDQVDRLPFFLRPFANRRPAFPEFFVRHYKKAMAMGLFGREELCGLLCPDLHAHIPKDPFWFYRKQALPGLSPVKTFQVLDVKCFMAELVLVKIDRASMAHSLEVRVPYLDRELFEYVFSLDESLCFIPGVTKALLFDNIKNDLPPEILARKKQGFVGPDSYYADIPWYEAGLSESVLVADGIVSRQGVARLIAARDHWRLWKLLVFELWYRTWVAGKTTE